MWISGEGVLVGEGGGEAFLNLQREEREERTYVKRLKQVQKVTIEQPLL